MARRGSALAGTVAKAVAFGVMLIVDYAHDAERYYSARRFEHPLGLSAAAKG